MRMTGRRESGNVDDRRGIVGGKTGMGIGTIIIIAMLTWATGGDPLSILQQVAMSDFSGNQTEHVASAEEEELKVFASQVLAGTEDVWSEQFRKMGLQYEAPRMVLFSGSVQSGCGGATSQTGPFYCSADQTVYLDLDFFLSMRENLGADGDFAYAYVIAHEVGHHVQYLLGTLTKSHSQMQRLSETEANKISIRLELQADYYAGLWAYHDNRMFSSLEDGDIEEALDAAHKIGDDYLQRKARGYAVPESFNHGTSEQRHRWLKRGLMTGNFTGGDTFGLSFDKL